MIRLEDVAARAGVSIITVSRVINAPNVVSPKTRARVQQAMQELHYVQNPVAKALASNRVGVIDVYVPAAIDLTNPFAMHFVAGISEVLSQRVYSFLIRRDLKAEHLCDGYIATGLLKNEEDVLYRYVSERGRQLVLFGHVENPEIDCIDVDNVRGAEKITDMLLENGHRRLAMINVDEDKDYTADRYQGFVKATAAAGLAKDELFVLRAKNNVDGGYTAMKQILREHPECTGVFCASDTLAIGAANAATKAGKRIPADISLVGFDGLGHNHLVRPTLTTVHQPIYEIGKMLAETLLERIQGGSVSVKRLVEPEILIGETMAAPRH